MNLNRPKWGVTLILSVLVSLCLPTVGLTQKGQDSQPTKLVDYDWQFSLTSPRLGEVLPERLAAAGRMGGRAAIVYPWPLYLEVSINPAPDDELDDLVRRFKLENGISQVQDGVMNKGTFAGLPAIRFSGLDGEEKPAVSFHSLMLKRAGHSYIATLWDHEPELRTPEFSMKTLEGAFQLRQGPVQPRAYPKDSIDGEGVGWTIENGTYVHPTFGLQIESDIGFYIRPKSQISRSRIHKEVICDFGHGWLSLDCTSCKSASVARRLKDRESLLGTWDYKSLSPKPQVGVFANHEAPFLSYAIGSSPYVVWRSEFFRNGIFYAIELGYPELKAEVNREKCFQMLKHIRFLSSKEKANLADPKKIARSEQLVTTTDDSFFNRVYRNFTHGFSFSPPVGEWRVLPKDVATRFQPGAVVHLEELKSNLNATVYVRKNSFGSDALSLHRSVLSRFKITLSEPKITKLGGRSAYQSDSMTFENPEFVYRIFTTIVEDRCFIIYTWCEADMMKDFDQATSKMSRNFRFFSKIPPMIGSRDGRFRDHRMRFEFEYPEGDKEWLDSPEDFNDETRSYHRIGFSGDLVVEILTESNLENINEIQVDVSRREFGLRQYYDSPPLKSESYIDGRKGPRWTWKKGDQFISFFHVVRGNTHYEITVFCKDKSRLTEVAKGFRLLE